MIGSHYFWLALTAKLQFMFQMFLIIYNIPELSRKKSFALFFDQENTVGVYHLHRICQLACILTKMVRFGNCIKKAITL